VLQILIFSDFFYGVAEQQKRREEMFQRLIFRRLKKSHIAGTASEKYSACSIHELQPYQSATANINKGELSTEKKITNHSKRTRK
jgi:hypothetical protein